MLAAGLPACSYAEPEPDTTHVGPRPDASVAADIGPHSVLGTVVSDSFGNAVFYTTIAGDTAAAVAAEFRITEAELSAFNVLQPGAPLNHGAKLRLIPGPASVPGATGSATFDANGVPTSYVAEPKDTLVGVLHRFGITGPQLAEANKVPSAHQINQLLLIPGSHLQLQKEPVDSRSGKGAVVNNSFGLAVFYTTVDGDSLDSLGYQFRLATAQLLEYNPPLAGDRLITGGTKVRLIPGELKIKGAQGNFTADADGVPLTYTTAPGDTEGQIAFRFGVSDLRAANRSLALGAPNMAWYELTDVPSGELAPGQTISVTIDKPINT
jgi:LysM repeat protein